MRYLHLGIIFLFAATILSIGVVAQAVEKTFTATFAYPVEDQANITGFRVKDKDNVTVLDGISNMAREFDITIDLEPGTCAPLYMVAYDAVEESPISNIAQACLGRKPIKAVGTFILELQE